MWNFVVHPLSAPAVTVVVADPVDCVRLINIKTNMSQINGMEGLSSRIDSFKGHASRLEDLEGRGSNYES